MSFKRVYLSIFVSNAEETVLLYFKVIRKEAKFYKILSN